MDILKHVDILDLIEIDVSPMFNGQVIVNLKCLEEGKQVFVDESSLTELNRIITKKCKNISLKDPNVFDYIKEFVGRMISELYKNGLVEIDDIPDAPSDPYKTAKEMYKHLN